ncbi:hypothetical protein JCM3765_001914 [Sporobolomyces pararoseus]
MSRILHSSSSSHHQNPPPPQDRPPPPPSPPPLPRRDRSFSTTASNRSPRSSFSSLLRGSVSLFRSRSNSTATTFVSANSSPQDPPTPDGEGAGGGRAESSSTVRRGGREEDQHLSEAECGEHDEEILEDEEWRRYHQEGGTSAPSWNWRDSPARDQMFETAECDEYVRMVQWENGW